MSDYFAPRLGGIERFSSALCESLVERGHRVGVLCSATGAGADERSEWRGIPVWRMPLAEGIARRDPALILKSQRTLRAAAQALQPEVVHLHLGGPIAGAWLGATLLSGVPLLVTVHDMPGAPEGFPSIGRVLHQAARITTNSRARLADVLGFGDDLGAKASCLPVSRPPRGVDRTQVQRNRTPLVFMAGRQEARKGFDLALHAFVAVLDQHPRARLALAGDGPEHAAIRALANRLGLDPFVEHLGAIDDEGIARMQARAWLCLVPSRHSESFGLAALEAMLAGTAVVASDTGGLPEVVEDGVTGLLVEPGSVDSLSAAMSRLLADPAALFAMGDAGRRRAQAQFGWRQCVEDHETALATAAAA
ncbi:MAG: glycosyltransferase family 4 protein [Burkholderiaceae bacterium]|nr:glycosyltransferase family 4 protein [Burkholderiaceae bacterium]